VIDFRYHLVSLVSVFMALAIGVVLGAGPLRDSIGDQLSSQVDELVQDKADLQQAVANRDAQIAERDAFIDAVEERLVGFELGGRDVLVVTLPGADSGTVDAVTEVVESAGAQVTGQVDLTPRWTDPGQSDFREELVAQLPAGEPGAADSVETRLGAALAGALLTPDVPAQDQSPDDAATVLESLTGGELVSVDGDPSARATLAVVVAGAPESSVGADDDAWAQAAAASHLALLSALDAGSAGVVLVGPPTAATGEGAIGQLRADDSLVAAVSSVDSADSPMGRITTVLALRAEVAGQSGQYGFGEDASSPIPTADLPAEEAPDTADEPAATTDPESDAGSDAGTDG